MIGVAILGSGFMARTHAAAWAEHADRAEVRVVASRTLEGAAKVAETCRAEVSDDLLAAMAREEERAGSLTPEFVTEVVDGLDRAENRLFVLEESRLFGGEHDAGDAVVTIQSGEGGTDAVLVPDRPAD